MFLENIPCIKTLSFFQKMFVKSEHYNARKEEIVWTVHTIAMPMTAASVAQRRMGFKALRAQKM